jgi:hypothetical protein
MLVSPKNPTKKKHGPRDQRRRTKPTIAGAGGADAVNEEPKVARADMSDEVLWSDLRQGARNFAGVSWQAMATVHIVVQGYAGDLPFVRFTPEGFQDVDCDHLDGARTFVQMKEVGAGEGRLAAADVADAFAHAEDGARGDAIALLTDGSLGSGLEFTGWDSTVSAQGGQPVEDVVSALVIRGLTDSAARGLLARARIVSLPWSLRQDTEKRLRDKTGAHPAVVSFVIGRLYEAVTESAAAQRQTPLSKPVFLTIQDVDAALAAVQSAVNVSGLDAAVVAGVCSTADFLNTSVLSSETFYLGVDGAPSHIAADLDVRRPREFASVAVGASVERSVLLLGPSGAGKSVLLWRAARDAVPGARVVRVQRLATSEDAQLLVRHVELLRPSATSPVVVAADNLGRPGMGLWVEAATRLREDAHVVLLGACRAEDFSPSLVPGTTRVVTLSVDEETATLLGNRVRNAGIDLAMDPMEALARCGGLLMEFLALLTTGQRLEQIIAQQAAALEVPGRELERDAARILTAAHSVGLGIHADKLGDAFAGSGSATAVGDALGVLENEHIVTSDGETWVGLHELRSRTLAEQLHRRPPPTLGATWARTAGLFTPEECGWLLRRVAERGTVGLDGVGRAAAQVMAQPSTTTAQAAELLEGAERADNAVYATACRPILEAALEATDRGGATIGQLGQFAYISRNQNQSLTVGVESFDAAMRKVEEIALTLPPRSSNVAETLAAVLSATSPADLARTPAMAADPASTVVVRLLDGGTLEEATRLLEAAEGNFVLDRDTAAWVLARFGGPTTLDEAVLWARLVDTTLSHFDPSDYEALAGRPLARAETVARLDPDAISVTYTPATRTASVTRLLPPEPEWSTTRAWDTPRQSKSEDLINDTAVAAARRLAAACPEARTVEVVTVTADGSRVKIGDLEPGFKQMGRDAFPRRRSVRQNVGFQAALNRATASRSWTALVESQITLARDLTDLVGQAPARLSSRDSEARQSAWTGQARAVVKTAAELVSRPAETAVALGMSHALVDELERATDSTSAALSDLANALPTLLDGRYLSHAMTLRDQVAGLRAARREQNPMLPSRGSPIPEALIDATRRLADVLAAIDYDPSARNRIRAHDLDAACEALVSRASSEATESQRNLLVVPAAQVDGARLHQVVDPTRTPGPSTTRGG